jgi:hypothetical protein
MRGFGSFLFRLRDGSWTPTIRTSPSAKATIVVKNMRDSILQPLIQRKTTATCSGSLSTSAAEHEHSNDVARKVLATRGPSGVLGERTTASDRNMVRKANITGIIFPWMLAYKVWWTLTAFGAIFTVFFGPFQVAFQREPGTFNDAAAVIELTLNLIFTVDILVNFNLAFYKNEVMVFERSEIFREYFSRMFWIDLIGVCPFETVALYMAGELGNTGRTALLFSLLRLLRFVRLHRMKRLSDLLQYNARVSLLWFTLTRNLAAVLFTTHLAACSMYFLARLRNFDDDTWLGPLTRGHDMTGFDRYVTSLYWYVMVALTTLLTGPGEMRLNYQMRIVHPRLLSAVSVASRLL